LSGQHAVLKDEKHLEFSRDCPHGEVAWQGDKIDDVDAVLGRGKAEALE